MHGAQLRIVIAEADGVFAGDLGHRQRALIGEVGPFTRFPLFGPVTPVTLKSPESQIAEFGGHVLQAAER